MKFIFNLFFALVGTLAENQDSSADTFAIYKSEDRGRSWMRADTGMPLSSRINAFESFNNKLFAATDSGIYRSKNGGLSWELASGDTMRSTRILSIVGFDGYMFAGTDGQGLLVSSNDGKLWVPAPTFLQNKIRVLTVLNGKLYVGTENNGVYVSGGFAQPWIHLVSGLPKNAQVFEIVAVKEKVYAGFYSLGLYQWQERKRSWIKSNTVKPIAMGVVGETLVVGHNPGGLFWSDNQGKSWTKGKAEENSNKLLTSLFFEDSGELGDEAPVWAIRSGHGLIFAGASDGVFLSQDRGRNWKRTRAGLPPRSPGIAFLIQPDLVLLGTIINNN